MTSAVLQPRSQAHSTFNCRPYCLLGSRRAVFEVFTTNKCTNVKITQRVYIILLFIVIELFACNTHKYLKKIMSLIVHHLDRYLSICCHGNSVTFS